MSVIETVGSADSHPSWCPGCGNFPILKTVDAALDEAEIDRRKLVLVSGIGQAAKLPFFVSQRTNLFDGLHGRAVPAATGIKLANHALTVVITSGDGDMYGEGGNHLLHGMRRNVGVKAFVHNNQVYGLTKGQASPTSEVGFKTKAQPDGVTSLPLNPLAVAICEDVSFVGRTFSGDSEHMKEMMLAALRTEGFALLDILQPCVTFNPLNTFKWYKDRVSPIGDDHDPTDRDAALRLAFTWGDEIPIGVYYRSERPSFESRLDVLTDKTLVAQFAETGG
jgi:2-oxoglutarate ferredoxin oxidoreductase subunit beta